VSEICVHLAATFSVVLVSLLVDLIEKKNNRTNEMLTGGPPGNYREIFSL